MKKSKKVSYIIYSSLILILVMLSTNSAWASGWRDPSDPTTDPHEYYYGDPEIDGADTDYCLQCHDIHEAKGDYALMVEDTLVQTCATCHGIYTPLPTGERNPGYPGDESMVSSKNVYKVAVGDRYTHEGHRMGLGLDGTTDTYTYGDSITTQSADYIPGSGSANDAVEYVNRISSWNNFVAANDMSNYLASSSTALGGLYCASCHSPHGTKWGFALHSDVATVPPDQINLKLLSGRPNHATSALDASNWESWAQDGWRYCGTCHEQRLDSQSSSKSVPHNHPSTVCVNGCHGADGLGDFPHTSLVPNLLPAEPDEFCIDCHPAGNLP